MIELQDTFVSYIFLFLGDPVPLARPRFSRRGTYDSQKFLKGKYAFQALAQMQPKKCLMEGPIEMHCHFFMPIPESASKKTKRILQNNLHTKKPDLSNLIKFIEDVMEGIVFENDSQIVAIKAHKTYSDEPKTVVKIWNLTETREE